MKNKSTLILSIVFLILLGLLGSFYLGWWKSPLQAFVPPNTTILGDTSNTNKRNLIRRPPNTTYEAAIKDGDSYFQNGHFQDAIDEYTRASQIEKTRLDPYQKIAESYLMLGEPDKAYENFAFVLGKDPNGIQAKIGLARTYIYKDQWQNALDILLALSSDNQEVRYYTGLVRAEQGDMDKALFNLTKAVELNNQTPLAAKAQNVLNSVSEFNLFTDGKSIHLRTLLARSFIQNQEYQVASSVLKNVLKEDKNYRDAWVLLGFDYYLTGQYDPALDALNTAYSLDPEKPQTQYFLGLTYTKLNQSDKALTFLILALKNNFEPRSDVQKRIADLYLDMHNYDEALNTYLEIIQEGQVNDINNYVRPIWIYIDIKKQPIQALELAKQAQAKYPEDAMGFNMVGWAALANDDLDTAQKNLEEAMKRDPNIQAVYLNLGDLYVKRGDKEKAKDFYKRAYFIDKNSSVGSLAASKYNELEQAK